VNDKILITGATGLLGLDLTARLKRDYRALGVSTKNFDILDYDEVNSFLDRMRPDIVLHAAAWADVDACEKDKKKAMAVNASATRNIALGCARIGARMMYYSTDYVFDGRKDSPYGENDLPQPVNVYGLSKLEGEQSVLKALDNAVVMRISWLFGTGKDCFVTGLIKAGLEQIRAKRDNLPYEPIKIVSDQTSTPTWTVDIAEQTAKIIESDLTGVIHVASHGAASRVKLAEDIFEELSWDIDLAPCLSTEFPLRAPRPLQTPLECTRINELNLNLMRHYQEAIREFLMVYKDDD
jgi:dTDP-4-dehydrorhamnose reductase